MPKCTFSLLVEATLVSPRASGRMSLSVGAIAMSLYHHRSGQRAIASAIEAAACGVLRFDDPNLASTP
jgi:phosphoglycerate-specific signal transduction histidine kinase